MKRRSVCLVTEEFYPATAGGIGRLLYNRIREIVDRGAAVDFSLLVRHDVPVTDALLQGDLGSRLRIHRVKFRHGPRPLVTPESVFPPADAFTEAPFHAQSLDICLALQEMARRGESFDVVEFPDFGGAAFCALQEKRLGRGFEDTLLAVRLHGAQAVLQQFEWRYPNQELAKVVELERRALEEADLVIGHLQGVIRFSRNFFGFDAAWEARARVEFPPAVLGGPGPVARTSVRSPDLLFPTKLQDVKRPDLFVRGAALFMLRHPEFLGRAVLLARAAGREQRDRLERLIPKGLRGRFAFDDQTGERDRTLQLSKAIAVICSSYESLNLAAYEAGAAGATVVLNATCVAFGEETPWRDGRNCHLFDGTVEGLVSALELAWQTPHPERVQWQTDASYWEAVTPQRTVASTAARRPLVSVVITNHNLGAFLPTTLASVAASDYRETEVVLVDDASTEPSDHEVLKELERKPPVENLQVLRQRVNRGLAGARNVGIQASRGEYVLPLDADDCIAPGFLGLAVRALESHREFSLVVPTLAGFRTDADLAARQFCNWVCFLGNVPSLGLIANQLSSATALIRRSVFETVRYDERLPSYEDWDLYLRLAQSGHRFLVTNDVQFFYRQRKGSMISGVDRARHYLLLSRLLGNLAHPLHPGTRLFALLVPAAERERGGGWPGRYRLADAINEVVKRVPSVHRLLKTLVVRARRSGGE